MCGSQEILAPMKKDRLFDDQSLHRLDAVLFTKGWPTPWNAEVPKGIREFLQIPNLHLPTQSAAGQESSIRRQVQPCGRQWQWVPQPEKWAKIRTMPQHMGRAVRID